jgi:hypothetical protein
MDSVAASSKRTTCNLARADSGSRAGMQLTNVRLTRLVRRYANSPALLREPGERSPRSKVRSARCLVTLIFSPSSTSSRSRGRRRSAAASLTGESVHVQARSWRVEHQREMGDVSGFGHVSDAVAEDGARPHRQHVIQSEIVDRGSHSTFTSCWNSPDSRTES